MSNDNNNRVRSKSYITPRPSPLIKTASATNIPVFVGCYSQRVGVGPAAKRAGSKNSLQVTPTTAMRYLNNSKLDPITRMEEHCFTSLGWVSYTTPHHLPIKQPPL